MNMRRLMGGKFCPRGPATSIALGPAILLLLGAVGVSYSQTGAVTMTTAIVPKAGGGTDVINTVHNFSSVPITAWIFAKKAKQGNGMAYTIEDGVVSDDMRQIEVGGERKIWSSLGANPSTDRSILVTALFADGSTFGNADWARVIVLRRQYAFRVDQTAISDLQAVRNMAQSEMIQFLDASEASQISAAKAARQRSALYAAGLPADDQQREMFEERNGELRAANIQAVADDEWRTLISNYYREIKGTLATPSPLGATAEARSQTLLGWYSDRLQRLTESHPPLFSAAMPAPGRGK
jgi:hypothetical protein